ncbi:MAG: acylneuraminate cytidylyltransferase family protein [Candidatus Berkelbacteria bacterium]|nr:acylneuraminate cytidylyltransferase family protein [Candidatus Berkelbacteria bacterium]
MTMLSTAKKVAFIFARGGSKGLPGKNIKLLGGKPLIAWSIETALRCPSIESVFVSTDDQEIANVAKVFGACVPFMRPAELATDTAPEWLSWQHAIRWHQDHEGLIETFVSLPPTSPFRSVADIEACIHAYDSNDDADIVITAREAARSPYFNMVTLNRDGRAQLMIEPKQSFSRRQDVPVAFDITTVAYVANADFVLKASAIFEGKVFAVIVPAERAMDIDTPFDFMLAECMAAKQETQELNQ